MAGSKKRIQYRYDALGNRVGMTAPDGGRFTYAYDSPGRISHLVNPQGERTSYAYDPGGRRTVKKLANATARERRSRTTLPATSHGWRISRATARRSPASITTTTKPATAPPSSKPTAAE